MSRIIARHGQTLLLLFFHECREIHCIVTSQLQLQRAWYEHARSGANSRRSIRDGFGHISDRLAVQSSLLPDEDLFARVSSLIVEKPLHCVLIDEAQFLSKKQVLQLGRISDHLDIPVLAYGLRTDFQGEPFEGSKYLLAIADNLKEIKAICHCGSKATMVIRQDPDGNVITSGKSVEIGGNDRYVSMCRKHFYEAFGAID